MNLCKQYKGVVLSIYKMRLTSNDLSYIIRDFPSVKLSYVKNIHKKVSSANVFLAIPKGAKYYWFHRVEELEVSPDSQEAFDPATLE